jgi:hypothetical protein
MAIKPAGLLDRSFYFILSLIIAAVVISGFSRTIGARLFHPAVQPPLVLWVHGVIFTGWIVLFITQTALISTRNVRVHRKLGWWGIALGAAIPIVGAATAIAMGRFHVQQGRNDVEEGTFLVIPLWDIVAFTVLFGLAIYFRRRPEFHRRLMLIATCALTGAAIGRLIPATAPDEWIYLGVDALILLGVGRDWIATHRVHAVYSYGFPALLAGQTITLYLDVTHSPGWLAIAHRLIG